MVRGLEDLEAAFAAMTGAGAHRPWSFKAAVDQTRSRHVDVVRRGPPDAYRTRRTVASGSPLRGASALWLRTVIGKEATQAGD
jgi:hypothetical protein